MGGGGFGLFSKPKVTLSTVGHFWGEGGGKLKSDQKWWGEGGLAYLESQKWPQVLFVTFGGDGGVSQKVTKSDGGREGVRPI